MRLAYHNHDFELTPMDGQLPLELLLRGTDPALVDFELDLYWATFAGQDPLDWFARHPGRFAMLHLKDSAGAPDHRMTAAGAGRIDFARILARRGKAGVKHVFVEHDNPADAFASVRASRDYLARLAVPAAG
jgi:sugar phosphate isomerase/epimerase